MCSVTYIQAHGILLYVSKERRSSKKMLQVFTVVGFFLMSVFLDLWILTRKLKYNLLLAYGAYLADSISLMYYLNLPLTGNRTNIFNYNNKIKVLVINLHRVKQNCYKGVF